MVARDLILLIHNLLIFIMIIISNINDVNILMSFIITQIFIIIITVIPEIYFKSSNLAKFLTRKIY